MTKTEEVPRALPLSAGMRLIGESSLIFHRIPLGRGFQRTDFEGHIVVKLLVQHCIV